MTGFAAACTAGILLPMKWMMGIRLAKEDELQGLDATGKKDFASIRDKKRGKCRLS